MIMPISAENKELYPDNWEEIRQRILKRARHRCEECGVKDHDIGWRDKKGDWHGIAEFKEGANLIEIILTIAHLDHDPRNSDDDENLRAWCQQCHNRYDAQFRELHRHETRIKKQKEAGQLFLFE